jgi:hypothetical protein
MIIRIASHEFKAYFKSPMAWTVLAVLQLILGYLFLTQIETFTLMQDKLANIEGAPDLTDIIVIPLFSNAGIILLLVTPLLTMRLICEERRNKTLSLLLSAPISDTQIILGKYLGTLSLLGIIILLISLMPLSLMTVVEFDKGKLLANVLGLSLLCSAFTAVGIFMSTVVGHPTVAAIGTMGILLILWLLNINSTLSDNPNEFLSYFSLLKHFQIIQTGLLDSSDIIYFVLFICSFLILTVKSLSQQRFQK